MKKYLEYIVVITFLLIFIGIVYIFKDRIDLFYKNLVYKDSLYILKDKNEYYRDYDFDFVKNKKELIARKKEDIKDIYYTGLNSGQDIFEFKCSDEYKKCLKDVKKLADDNEKLSDINNFVHPFNSYKNIHTSYNDLGIVTITIDHMYTKEDIEAINTKIFEIYPILSQGYNKDDPNSAINALKTMHDYIINTTKYDSERSDNNVINYKSDIAYGPLFEGYALCGGYTDLYELLLEQMHIKSFKVSGDIHIWNAIELNGTWYNLDLTWDDPVTNTGQEVLLDDYFLISTSKMLSKDKSQHTFNQDVYSELKST